MMTEDDAQKIIEMHKAGAAIPSIANEFGVSLVTIKRWIANIRRTHDLPYRKKSTQKVRMDRVEHDESQTSWNLKLAREYITREWSNANALHGREI